MTGGCGGIYGGVRWGECAGDIRCGGRAALRRELRAEGGAELDAWAARYNIAPTDKVPILLRKESGARRIELMNWGIVRARNGRAARQINGRSESVSPYNLRCAVIGDGFYEWGGKKGPQRQPYFFIGTMTG